MKTLAEEVQQLYNVGSKTSDHSFIWFIIGGIALLVVYNKLKDYWDGKGVWVMWVGVSLVFQGLFKIAAKYIF